MVLSEEFNLSDLKMAFFYCLFKFCFPSALEDCSNNPGELCSTISCNSIIVHILSTLVLFDNWIQLLTHETSKSRHRSAETLCKSLLGKSSAGKIDCKHVHWPSVRSLQNNLTPGCNRNCRSKISLPSAVLRLTKCLLECGCSYNQLQSSC